ncbi:MAG: hypothetical protein V1735_03385 [Nanoarchaeota archaeon]
MDTIDDLNPIDQGLEEARGHFRRRMRFSAAASLFAFLLGTVPPAFATAQQDPQKKEPVGTTTIIKGVPQTYEIGTVEGSIQADEVDGLKPLFYEWVTLPDSTKEMAIVRDRYGLFRSGDFKARGTWLDSAGLPDSVREGDAEQVTLPYAPRGTPRIVFRNPAMTEAIQDGYLSAEETRAIGPGLYAGYESFDANPDAGILLPESIRLLIHITGEESVLERKVIARAREIADTHNTPEHPYQPEKLEKLGDLLHEYDLLLTERDSMKVEVDLIKFNGKGMTAEEAERHIGDLEKRLASLRDGLSEKTTLLLDESRRVSEYLTTSGKGNVDVTSGTIAGADLSVRRFIGGKPRSVTLRDSTQLHLLPAQLATLGVEGSYEPDKWAGLGTLEIPFGSPLLVVSGGISGVSSASSFARSHDEEQGWVSQTIDEQGYQDQNILRLLAGLGLRWGRVAGDVKYVRVERSDEIQAITDILTTTPLGSEKRRYQVMHAEDTNANIGTGSLTLQALQHLYLTGRLRLQSIDGSGLREQTSIATGHDSIPNVNKADMRLKDGSRTGWGAELGYQPEHARLLLAYFSSRGDVERNERWNINPLQGTFTTNLWMPEYAHESVVMSGSCDLGNLRLLAHGSYDDSGIDTELRIDGELTRLAHEGTIRRAGNLGLYWRMTEDVASLLQGIELRRIMDDDELIQAFTGRRPHEDVYRPGMGTVRARGLWRTDRASEQDAIAATNRSDKIDVYGVTVEGLVPLGRISLGTGATYEKEKRKTAGEPLHPHNDTGYRFHIAPVGVIPVGHLDLLLKVDLQWNPAFDGKHSGGRISVGYGGR